MFPNQWRIGGVRGFLKLIYMQEPKENETITFVVRGKYPMGGGGIFISKEVFCGLYKNGKYIICNIDGKEDPLQDDEEVIYWEYGFNERTIQAKLTLGLIK